ncbi:MAG: efflux RND transporter periplasmic adaptor subunit [Pirellulaceae bacterium]
MKIFINIVAIVAILAVGVYGGMRILKHEPRHAAGEGAGHHGEAEGHDYPRGPHHGRLLSSGDFSVEVTIYEPDIPPQFRVFPFLKGEPLNLDEVDLVIELHRFGGRVDRFNFNKQDDYLLGDLVVEEPHSFDVKVMAKYGGKSHAWEYESYEGRVEISEQAAASVSLQVETAGPRTMRTTVSMNGKIIPNENRMAQVSPRYPGIVLEVRKKLGDQVTENEVLAVIESNESLQPYEIKSRIDGTVTYRDIALGEFVSTDTLMYVVADLSTVWVELNVHRHDFHRLGAGQKVFLDGGESGPRGEAEISYLSPFGAENTQTMLARAELPNPKMEWRPGLFVNAEVIVKEEEVPVAVKASALQTFRDWDVVFMRDGTLYEIAILELGRRDGEWIEVLSGLEPGTEYVTENSFVVKADVLKSGASHDH